MHIKYPLHVNKEQLHYTCTNTRMHNVVGKCFVSFVLVHWHKIGRRFVSLISFYISYTRRTCFITITKMVEY